MDVVNQGRKNEIYSHLKKVKVVAVAKGSDEKQQYIPGVTNEEFMETMKSLRLVKKHLL